MPSASMARVLENGLLVTIRTASQSARQLAIPPSIVSDGGGGAIITWVDFRSSPEINIYAQRVNAAGIVQWDTDGIAIATAAGFKDLPKIASDGEGGGIITWADGRSGSAGIYAQQINSNGNLGVLTDVTEPHGQVQSFLLHQNYPNPFNPSTTIAFSLPTSEYVTLKVLDLLGQEVETLSEGRREAGEYKVNWNSGDLPSGVYFYRLQAGDFVKIKKLILLK